MVPAGLSLYALFSHRQYHSLTQVDGTGMLGELFYFIHVGNNHRRQGRLGFCFKQCQIKFDNGVADFYLLTFCGYAGESFTFQLNGVDTEMYKQLYTRV